MSGHEPFLTFAWINSTLKGNATFMSEVTGGVWRGYAPPGTATPYCIFGFQGGSDVVTMNGVRLFTEGLYQVKVIGPADGIANLSAAAQQMDSLIGSPPTSGSVVIGGVTVAQVLSSYRQSPLALDELVNGQLWSTIGGIYRILTEQR